MNTNEHRLYVLIVRRCMIIMLLCSILLPFQVYAKDVFDNLISTGEDLTDVFPAFITMKGFAYLCHNEIHGPIELIIHNNKGKGQFEFNVISTITTASLAFDRSLGPLSSETVFPSTIKKIVDLKGHDKRIYKRYNEKKDVDTISLTYYLEGREKRNKKFSYDRNTIPADMVMIMCQALLLKGIKKDFLFDIISLEDALKVRMSMIYHFTDNPLSLSKDFDFPEKVHDAIIPGEKYHVYEMKVEGLLSLFVWSNWCFVYKDKYPYGFTAYWGGDGKNADGMYILEHIINP